MQALGLIETRGTLAAIEAADAMMKAADVSLLQKVRIGGGLVTIAVTGDVAAVKASVDAGCAAVERLSQSSLYGSHVIPRPHEEVESLFRPEPPNKKGHRDCETKPETEEARVEETENTESEVPTIEEADLEESDHAGKVCGGTCGRTSVKESGSGRIWTGCRVKNGKSGLKE